MTTIILIMIMSTMGKVLIMFTMWDLPLDVGDPHIMKIIIAIIMIVIRMIIIMVIIMLITYDDDHQPLNILIMFTMSDLPLGVGDPCDNEDHYYDYHYDHKYVDDDDDPYQQHNG